MLSLKQILKEMEGDGETLQFPDDNFVLSVSRSKKTLLFTPQYHKSITNKIRILVNMLKQNFNITRVSDKDMDSFEVEVDPREDFEAVIEFIKSQSENTV